MSNPLLAGIWPLWTLSGPLSVRQSNKRMGHITLSNTLLWPIYYRHEQVRTQRLCLAKFAASLFYLFIYYYFCDVGGLDKCSD